MSQGDDAAPLAEDEANKLSLSEPGVEDHSDTMNSELSQGQEQGGQNQNREQEIDENRLTGSSPSPTTIRRIIDEPIENAFHDIIGEGGNNSTKPGEENPATDTNVTAIDATVDGVTTTTKPGEETKATDASIAESSKLDNKLESNVEIIDLTKDSQTLNVTEFSVSGKKSMEEQVNDKQHAVDKSATAGSSPAKNTQEEGNANKKSAATTNLPSPSQVAPNTSPKPADATATDNSPKPAAATAASQAPDSSAKNTSAVSGNPPLGSTNYNYPPQAYGPTATGAAYMNQYGELYGANPYAAAAAASGYYNPYGMTQPSFAAGPGGLMIPMSYPQVPYQYGYPPYYNYPNAATQQAQMQQQILNKNKATVSPTNNKKTPTNLSTKPAVTNQKTPPPKPTKGTDDGKITNKSTMSTDRKLRSFDVGGFKKYGRQGKDSDDDDDIDDDDDSDDDYDHKRNSFRRNDLKRKRGRPPKGVVNENHHVVIDPSKDYTSPDFVIPSTKNQLIELVKDMQRQLSNCKNQLRTYKKIYFDLREQVDAFNEKPNHETSKHKRKRDKKDKTVV